MRILLPALVAVLVGMALLLPEFFPGSGRAPVDITIAETGSEATGKGMINITYSGIDKEGRPFSIYADSVDAAPARADLLLLTRPRAQILLKDGAELTLAAGSGAYDRARESVDLREQVTLRRGTDLVIRTSQARVELAAGEAFGDQLVDGEASFGALAGKGFHIADSGETSLASRSDWLPYRRQLESDFTPRARSASHPARSGASAAMIRTRMQSLVIAMALLGIALSPVYTATAAESGSDNRQRPGAILIDAAKGIEWIRTARLVIARGDARAKRDDQEVRAEVLTAHYRERHDGTIDVWRIDADGKVRYTSESESAFGERATYDVDKQVMTMSGGKQLGVTASASRITAEKELEYETRTLIARGNAVAVDGDRTVYGEVISVRLREQVEKGQSRLQQLEAEGNVRVITPEEDIRADRGAYNVESGVATLDGSVKIVKGTHELNGCRGETNLKTGVSRITACPGQSNGRVRGIILPESLKNQ